MRINSSTPTWRIVVRAIGTLAAAGAFIWGAFAEQWSIALAFGVVVVVGAIEDARDRILDRLDRRPAPHLSADRRRLLCDDHVDSSREGS